MPDKIIFELVDETTGKKRLLTPREISHVFDNMPKEDMKRLMQSINRAEEGEIETNPKQRG